MTQILSHLDYLDESIGQLEEKIEVMCRPFWQVTELLDTEPGVDRRSAQDIIAEIGVDMNRFPSEKHLCSWTGISPGNNESGGKRKSGRTTKGNKGELCEFDLKAILVECAHAAGRTKNTYLGARYHRLAGKKGTKRAAVAVGHDIIAGAYFIIRDKVPYRELGADYFDRTNKQYIVRSQVRRLERLGYKVQLEELDLAA